MSEGVAEGGQTPSPISSLAEEGAEDESGEDDDSQHGLGASQPACGDGGGGGGSGHATLSPHTQPGFGYPHHRPTDPRKGPQDSVDQLFRDAYEVVRAENGRAILDVSYHIVYKVLWGNL